MSREGASNRIYEHRMVNDSLVRLGERVDVKLEAIDNEIG